MSKIEQVLRCAFSAFSPKLGDKLSQEKFARLRTVLNSLSANDVKLEESLEIIDKNRIKKAQDCAPVTYIHLVETPVFSAGIFVIQKDSKIPIHDHPGMHGLLKVIHGKLSIQSVTTDTPTSVNKSSYSIIHTETTELDVNDECQAFTPERNNVHEITAIGGTASFLDILAPPYDYEGHFGQKRICNYYGLQETGVPGFQRVRRIACPLNFWCDESPYLGPSVSHLFEDF